MLDKKEEELAAQVMSLSLQKGWEGMLEECRCRGCMCTTDLVALV
jgi:hypothetical protein